MVKAKDRDMRGRPEPITRATPHKMQTGGPVSHPSRAALLRTIAELRRANADLQMLGLAVQDTNKGLQEANKALETSNEELHMLNEQLILVNGEMQIDLIELRAKQADTPA